MLIENTTFIPTHPTCVMLRSDYGSTWNGKLTIKNCHVEDDHKPIATVVSSTWVNHFFGYDCHTPEIEIDNLTFKNPKEKLLVISMGNKQKPGENVGATTFSDGTNNENPYFMPAKMTVKNNHYDTVYYLPKRFGLYDNTELSGITLVEDEA